MSAGCSLSTARSALVVPGDATAVGGQNHAPGLAGLRRVGVPGLRALGIEQSARRTEHAWTCSTLSSGMASRAASAGLSSQVGRAVMDRGWTDPGAPAGGKEARVRRQLGGGAVVVDFHPQRDAGPLPRIAQGRDARMDLGVAQTVHAAVEAQHHDGGPAGGQGRQGGRRVGPLAVRGHVGGQHAPGPHQIGAVRHRGSHGRRPAALPDIGIVVQGRIGLAASRHEDAAQDDGNAAMRRVGGAGTGEPRFAGGMAWAADAASEMGAIAQSRDSSAAGNPSRGMGISTPPGRLPDVRESFSIPALAFLTRS